MRVLVACEESQAVCIAFRERGHEAYSCDLEPCSGGHPEWHFQKDIGILLGDGITRGFDKVLSSTGEWDLIIAFPPCTHLSVSGARWFKHKEAEQAQAVSFFERFTNLKGKWAIENPIGIMSTHYRKPDQIIQPWQFGHGETKSTCLWLKGLPKLRPTNIVSGREQRIWRLPPSKDRAKLRSKTYSGIAKAMAEQWG